jgi:hypothetical protein
LAYPLSLGLSFGAHAAVDKESRVPPGENPIRPLRAEKLPADKEGQAFAVEDFGEPRVVEPRDPMEDACLIRSALGHEQMQMGMKIDAIPERLDDGRNPRLEGRSGHGPEINKNRSELSFALLSLS